MAKRKRSKSTIASYDAAAYHSVAAVTLSSDPKDGEPDWDIGVLRRRGLETPPPVPSVLRDGIDHDSAPVDEVLLGGFRIANGYKPPADAKTYTDVLNAFRSYVTAEAHELAAMSAVIQSIDDARIQLIELHRTTSNILQDNIPASSRFKEQVDSIATNLRLADFYARLGHPNHYTPRLDGRKHAPVSPSDAGSLDGALGPEDSPTPPPRIHRTSKIHCK
ncbi:hypothetical protein EV714DRAFT_276397 [Schizophyllum commune]